MVLFAGHGQWFLGSLSMTERARLITAFVTPFGLFSEKECRLD